MKAITVFAKSGRPVGKLWVRPAVEGEHIHRVGGLIEIQLDRDFDPRCLQARHRSANSDTRLYCTEVVDCRPFREHFVNEETSFETAQEAHAYITGIQAADPDEKRVEILRGPWQIKGAKKWRVSTRVKVPG